MHYISYKIKFTVVSGNWLWTWEATTHCRPFILLNLAEDGRMKLPVLIPYSLAMIFWIPDLCLANLRLKGVRIPINLSSVIALSKSVKGKLELLKLFNGPIISIHTIFIFFLLNPAHKDIISLYITHNILLLQILVEGDFPVLSSKKKPLVPKKSL